MSEPTPDILDDQQKEYLATIRAQELHEIQDTSVDIETAHRLIPEIKTAVSEFAESQIYKQLGPETQAELDKILHRILQDKDGIVFTTQEDKAGRFIDYGMFEGKTPQNYSLVYVSGTETLVDELENIRRVTQKLQLSIDEQTLQGLVLRLVVWHELGHAVSLAHARANPEDTSPADTLGQRKPLEYNSLMSGISPMFGNPTWLSIIMHVQAERIAEGIAQVAIIDALRDKVRKKGYIPPVFNKDLFDSPHSTDYLRTVEILQTAQSEAEARENLKEEGLNEYTIGYYNPADADEIYYILELTR